MCIALIGGMDRLERKYIEDAKSFGITLKVYTKKKIDLPERIKHVDAVIIFTGKVSHLIKNQVIKCAYSTKIPVILCHSCGLSSLRKCIIEAKRLCSS